MSAASATSTSKQYENVNGSLITLSVQRASTGPGRQQRRFTVRYGATRPSTTAMPARIWLAAAVALNVLVVMYAQLSLTALLTTASVFAGITLMWLTHCVQYESMLVVPGVGIQCSVQYVRGREEQFIPWSAVEDVIINELVHLNRVLHYLTVLAQDSGETKIIPLFKYTKPRLQTLETIYSEIQILLSAREQDASKTGSGDI